VPSNCARLLWTFLTAACLSTSSLSVAQEIQWLPDGSEYSLRCSGDGAGERGYRLSRLGEGMKLERLGRDVYQAGPVWALLFTDIFDEFENGKAAKTMRFISGDRDGLKSLAPGSVSRAEYEWTRGRSANRTHTVKVEEKKIVKTESFGEQEVVVVTDTVTGPIHNIRMETHYAPALKTFVWRRFENFGTRQRTECSLIKVSQSQK
jgi:hypothetical protein